MFIDIGSQRPDDLLGRDVADVRGGLEHLGPELGRVQLEQLLQVADDLPVAVGKRQQRTRPAPTEAPAAPLAQACVLVGSPQLRSAEWVVVSLLNTLMALPTVLVGLLVYSFLTRRGPLGSLELLYTQTAMVIGQVILAFPIIATFLPATMG